jgi:probable non-F420 flavinoid oxidoreductase
VTIVGIHASHEQIPPSALLRAVRLAETAGFEAAMCSDHLAPWSVNQGQSGHAWTWLGSALHATSMSFGVVTAPGQRYHPVVLAQAIATLGELFPGRFWAALGTGEAVNEHVTGSRWPDKPTRDARLLECVQVMRALLAGNEVTHHGLIEVDRARLWSLPDTTPRLVGAAVTADTARVVGGWADGLVTVNQPLERLQAVFDAFRAGGGEGKPIFLQVHLSWDEDEAVALAIAHDQWKSNVFASSLAWNLELPEQFDEAARFVEPDDLRSAVLISSRVERHLEWLHEYVALGVDGLYLHHVGQTQDAFIDVFASKVLPEFR